MSNSCESLDTLNISPVRPKIKNTSTPMRTRRKTSRREKGVDVHSSSSAVTPHRSPRLQRSSQNSPRYPGASFSSPSSSIPCSQDNRPDVIWDFTSPKLPKGGKKKEFKITVQELLENLNQSQASEGNAQSAPYIKLLENWMSKQPTETTVKKIVNNKKELKQRSRRRIEELKKFIESIQRPNKDIVCGAKLRSPDNFDSKQGSRSDNLVEPNTSFKNSFLDGGSTDDSSEELWGDMDNSFIVKATQELDKVTVKAFTQIEEVVSTIPATLPNAPVTKCVSPMPVQDKHSCEQFSDLLLQLSNVDWDLDGDDEWDNGFLMEDDDLSLIPEDVLSGECITQGEEKENMPESKAVVPENQKTLESKIQVSANLNQCIMKNSPTVFCLGETELSVVAQNAELFNSFEDDSFEDESLLCQPEVLSRIDEVESKLSQPKCTPEEIEKKKDKAIQRRKIIQSKKKT